MIDTPFMRLLGLSVPVQLAAMPGVATPELVAAVAAGGGLGMLPAAMLAPTALEQALAGLEEESRAGVVGVNFLVPFLDPHALDVAARRAKLVELFYGDPDPALVERARAHGARVSWQVGSPEEAAAAARAGCDLVVAQGTEAGGHVRGTTRLAPLLEQVVESVDVPVVAAGGIATADDVAAALARGAAGVRVGTRFVATAESGAHPLWVQALLAASASDTCLTEAFSVLWPNAPHRVLSSAVAAAEALDADVVGEIPLGGERVPVQRFSIFCPTRDTTGHVDAMALYAGESVTHVRAVEPAAAILTDLAAGAREGLRPADARGGRA